MQLTTIFLLVATQSLALWIPPRPFRGGDNQTIPAWAVLPSDGPRPSGSASPAPEASGRPHSWSGSSSPSQGPGQAFGHGSGPGNDSKIEARFFIPPFNSTHPEITNGTHHPYNMSHPCLNDTSTHNHTRPHTLKARFFGWSGPSSDAAPSGRPRPFQGPEEGRWNHTDAAGGQWNGTHNPWNITNGNGPRNITEWGSDGRWNRTGSSGRGGWGQGPRNATGAAGEGDDAPSSNDYSR